MSNVTAALPNIGGALCSTPQSLADAHYYFLCVETQQTATFWGVGLIPTFELGQDFCTMHLTAKNCEKKEGGQVSRAYTRSRFFLTL